MNNKNKGRKIIKILAVIMAVILLFAIVAVIALRFVVLPKISKKLQESGRGELAAIVDQSNNMGTFAMIGEALTDKGMLEFVTGLDGKNVTDMVEVIETIEKENAETETTPEETKQQPEKSQSPKVSHDDVWQVGTNLHKPESFNSVSATDNSYSYVETPPDAIVKPTESDIKIDEKKPENKDGTTAYERISAVATSEEMADGLAIISKLDMGYVASLMADGLTSSEKTELKNYVYSKLTSSEISRALQLYNKYKKYL